MRKFALLTVIAIAASLLAGCSGGDSASGSTGSTSDSTTGTTTAGTATAGAATAGAATAGPATGSNAAPNKPTATAEQAQLGPGAKGAESRANSSNAAGK